MRRLGVLYAMNDDDDPPRTEDPDRQDVSATTVAVIAALALSCASNAPSPDPVEHTDEPPQPSVLPEPVPPPAPAPKPTAEPKPGPEPPPTAAALAKDTAILRGFDLLATTAQCSAGPDWATVPSMAYGELTPVHTGDRLHVITESTVERWTIEADEHSATASPTPPAPSPPARFSLATKNHAPSPSARLEPRRLTKPVTDARKLAAWLKKQVHFDVRPVGQLEGKFGDGVDRIVLFEPKRWDDPTAVPEEPSRRSELALLVAAGVPRSWLPFGRLAEDGEPGWEDGAYGLQVLAVVDIDGDDVQEILWLSQSIGGDPLWTGLELSYFDATDGFDAVRLGGCSYNGCDAFLPRNECRGVMKPKMR
jgi:hypothetical protein